MNTVPPQSNKLPSIYPKFWPIRWGVFIQRKVLNQRDWNYMLVKCSYGKKSTTLSMYIMEIQIFEMTLKGGETVLR